MTKRNLILVALALLGCADVHQHRMNSVHQIKDANGVSTWASIPPFYRPDIEWPWVIYDHGYGQLGSHIYSDSNLGDLVKSLASAGYIVIASDYRNINCWGNADCDDDIANLQDVWRAHLRLKPRPYVIGESMGAIVTWNAVSHNKLQPLAVVGIYPACSLAWMYSVATLAPSIEAAFGFHSPDQWAAATEGYDPLMEPVTDFTSFPIAMWASYSDAVVVRSQNEDPFAAAIRAAGGTVVIHTSRYNHGDASNFDPRAVIKFFSQASKGAAASHSGR